VSKFPKTNVLKTEDPKTQSKTMIQKSDINSIFLYFPASMLIYPPCATHIKEQDIPQMAAQKQIIDHT
jgi:hypothetical protein